MILTCEEAICRLFWEDFTIANVVRWIKELDAIDEFDICYLENPRKTVWMFKTAIFARDVRQTWWWNQKHCGWFKGTVDLRVDLSRTPLSPLFDLMVEYNLTKLLNL